MLQTSFLILRDIGSHDIECNSDLNIIARHDTNIRNKCECSLIYWWSTAISVSLHDIFLCRIYVEYQQV